MKEDKNHTNKENPEIKEFMEKVEEIYTKAIDKAFDTVIENYRAGLALTNPEE